MAGSFGFLRQVRKHAKQILGSAAPSSLPPMQKQDAQHNFLQHKEAHTDW